ncbi:hypothetical protein Curi_c12570 [Gottschalkia acidurici 9a]|uniref:ribonucleoside-diphosphate reductase n=1 Tax=Gottschalkia acidurici (strain ATCC 7906 / DSM 604 / BCRC 14475 / CIP 104303 / KCTC 5404 / NCIMB 10678 / 9a) TaxID=1128398 RepID=K0AWR9_GOTA9|nr:TIGR03905 family TSCPD domain-containing protein [Gottschalkia acidurici]AFS78268.1 hypothetical protein Curi_c12570 [Gottschalkia acidurici 9a]
MKFIPSGICPREISFDIEDNKVKNISFLGGCNGNLQALSILAEDMEVEELISKLKHITCGAKNTSCADQLSKALENYKSME